MSWPEAIVLCVVAVAFASVFWCVIIFEGRRADRPHRKQRRYMKPNYEWKITTKTTTTTPEKKQE